MMFSSKQRRVCLVLLRWSISSCVLEVLGLKVRISLLFFLENPFCRPQDLLICYRVHFFFNIKPVLFFVQVYNLFCARLETSQSGFWLLLMFSFFIFCFLIVIFAICILIDAVLPCDCTKFCSVGKLYMLIGWVVENGSYAAF